MTAASVKMPTSFPESPPDGLAACDQAAGSHATSSPDSAGRAAPSSPAGCDPSTFPPRRAAVVAFDATGQQRWSVPLPTGTDLDANVGPLVDGDTVYTTQGDELRALAAADGRQRWRLPLASFVYDASIQGGILVVRVGPLDHGQLLGVDPTAGRVRWRYPRQPGQLSWQHVSSADGAIATIGEHGALVVLDRHDGAARWSRASRGRGTPKVFTAAGSRVLRLDAGALRPMTPPPAGRWRPGGL
jgi:outer membrane protein assembly factor BamB